MNRFARLPARTRVLLFLTVALPLALAIILSSARYGREHRTAAERRLSARADSIILQATTPFTAQVPLPALLAAANARDHFAAIYVLAADTLRRDTATPPRYGPATIEQKDLAELRRADRIIVIQPLGGRLAVLAPLRDSLQWDITGALLLTDTRTAPGVLPSLPLALGLLVLLLVLLAAAAYAENAAAGARRSLLLLSIAGVYLPPLTFLYWLTTGLPVAPGGGGYRFWAVSYFSAWAVLAAIGLSLVRLTRRPLDLRTATAAWCFLAPSFLHLLLFSLGPILFSLWLSFHQWDLIAAVKPFVGLANYQALAQDADFWRALRNTAIYVLFVPIGMVVALALALLLDRGLPGQRALRAIFFLPYITSFVAISLVWKWMYEPDVGLLNTLLRALGLPAQPWLSDPRTALPSLMLMSIWMYCGYMMILFLAGLQSIPASLYESARMDGASAWQRFRRITLPLLRPTTFFVLVTMVIFMFQVFTAVYVMTEGGPLHATDVIVYHIYRNAWEYLRLGYASAMAWVLFAIIFLITLLQFRLLGRERTRW